MLLLGLWITWYVANVISAGKAGLVAGRSPLFDLTTTVFVLGLVFLCTLLVGLTLIFISLARQVNINKTYDNFIASVTHELKSPLASIRLHLETLAFRSVDGKRAAGLLGLMVRDADRLESLINTILEIASFEKQEVKQKLETYSAEELIQELVEQAMADFQIQDWAMDVHGCRDACIKVDPHAIKRVIDILVDNAVKYSVGPAVLRLRCFAHRRRFVVEFSDQGIGIPKESLRKIFRKFYRVEHRASPNVKGTGLGLFWASEIVRLQRGSIVAESDDGGGALFRITLPLSRGSERRTEVESA